jgi:hypothetical protein
MTALPATSYKYKNQRRSIIKGVRSILNFVGMWVGVVVKHLPLTNNNNNNNNNLEG